MAIHQYKVYHFQEYVDIITDIGCRRRLTRDMPPVLWSRGHRKQDWNLLPTLLRDVKLNPIGGARNAAGRAMEEELRKQHYIARNYHFLEKEPQTNVEWFEVMQHHGVKTRMLDWSESTMHSLIFALECFFDREKYRTEDRVNSSPCVWLLEPDKWNMTALKEILNNNLLIDSCIDRLHSASDSAKAVIKDRLSQLNVNLDSYLDVDSAKHLKCIFNLSTIIAEQQVMSNQELVYLLREGELHYCLSFILSNIYLPAELKKIDQVLPLAIVESYHSERIKAQKGAFSVFPYYEEDAAVKAAGKMKIPLDAMEYMYKGNHFLHKIQLCNPDEIAFEIMNAGLNVSWLYPEMPVVANAIESREIFM